MSDPKTTDRVTGHLVRLDDTRLVFLGESPDHPDTWFLGFRNSDGQDTKLTFSREAMTALVNLSTEPFKGARSAFPHKVVWRVVREGEVERTNNAQ
jgi:hypothetical protein